MSAPQPHGFRRTMDAVHAWTGVAFGALLFAIFLMGTLALFDREIDRWAQPATQMARPAQPVSLDAAVIALQSLAPDDAGQWLVYPPSERVPTLRVAWSGSGTARGLRDLDPGTGALLPDRGAPLGTQLFYPFHYSLHWRTADLGEWLVGAAAMAMLVGLVSGVATHRRLFKDFFTFRPGKTLQRSALDLHAVTAVFALPFHFVIVLSGLIIFTTVYLQPAIAWVYGGERNAFSREVLSRYTRPAAHAPLQQRISLDTLAAEAQAHWRRTGEPGEPLLLVVRRPRDAAAVVEVRRAYGRRMALEQGTVYFDAAQGTLLHAEALPAASKVQRFIAGLHLAQFDAPLLRWLYFAMGAGGCVMIATGSLAWVAKRAERQARLGQRGAVWLQAVNVAAFAGLPLAACTTLLLSTWPASWWTGGAVPLEAALRVFFGVWAASLLHALVLRGHGHRHWTQQCGLLAGLAGGAVLSRWAASGAPQTGAVLGVDLALLVVAAGAARVAWRLYAGPMPARIAGAAA